MTQATSLLFAHFTWTTLGRAPLLTPDRQLAARDAVMRQCARHACQAVALGMADDHMHLLVRARPDVVLDEFARLVRAAATWAIHALPASDGAFRWAPRYGVVSVSPAALPTVTDYLRDHRALHEEGRTVEAWEPPALDASTGVPPTLRSACAHRRAPRIDDDSPHARASSLFTLDDPDAPTHPRPLPRIVGAGASDVAPATALDPSPLASFGDDVLFVGLGYGDEAPPPSSLTARRRVTASPGRT